MRNWFNVPPPVGGYRDAPKLRTLYAYAYLGGMSEADYLFSAAVSTLRQQRSATANGLTTRGQSFPADRHSVLPEGAQAID
ncbi:hypothetical protein TSMEX_008391 [Taenia solium]|eukprot:TsM_000221800 transcript=TsM_000221800 gene=TsM_000221800